MPHPLDASDVQIFTTIGTTTVLAQIVFLHVNRPSLDCQGSTTRTVSVLEIMAGHIA